MRLPESNLRYKQGRERNTVQEKMFQEFNASRRMSRIARAMACPPPIDYRRRRRIFPAPSDIGRNHTRLLARAANAYLTEAFTWKIQRYIWQPLTGSDPLVTYGAALLHGPAAYSYRKLC